MVKEVKRFNSSFDRVDYYNKIVSDWFSNNYGKADKGDNVNLLNRAIITFRDALDLKRYALVLLNLVKLIYGANSNEFFTFYKVYVGFRSQIGTLNIIKVKLKDCVVPEHYKKAIDWKIRSISDRVVYLTSFFDSYKELTPLADYEKTLPEGITLYDDIWEHINDLELDDEYNSEPINNYLKLISEKVDLGSFNETKKIYEAYKANKLREIQENKDREKKEKIEHKFYLANDIAANYAGKINRQIMSNTLFGYNELFNSCLDMDKAKIYIVVSSYSAARNDVKPAMYFLGKNGKLVKTILKAAVFGIDDDPDYIKELRETKKYGYAELMIK